MSWRSSSRTRSCYTVPPCVCPPGERGPPGPAGALNWGADVYRVARNAVVAIVLGDRELTSDFSGVDFFAGFWVSPYTIATAWQPLSRESARVRVVVSRLDGPPISIDGVVTYAVPELNIALVTVNPNFYSGLGFEPLVLDISTDLSVGDDVFTITVENVIGRRLTATHFLKGTVTALSYAEDSHEYPTVTLLDYGLFVAAPGSVLIKDTGYYAALTCGHNVYSACPTGTTSTTTTAAAARYLKIVGMKNNTVGGPGGLLLQTVLAWASTDLGASVLSAPYAMGSVTIPFLRQSLALGQLVNTVYVPMVPETVNAETFDLGAVQNGSFVSDVTVANSVVTPFTYGPTTLTYGTDGSVTTDSNALRVGKLYLRSQTDALVDISGSGTQLTLTNDAEGWGSIPFTAPFRVSGTPIGVSVTTDNVAVDIYVSAIGFVTFTSDAFPTGLSLVPDTLKNLIRDPVGQKSQTLYVAPFASTDFILPGPADYSVDPGAPDRALVVHYLIQDETLTIQWSGYSQRTGDPVMFQVILSGGTGDDPATDPASGQVRFGYLTMPGAWAGSVWLSAHQLTSNPDIANTVLVQLLDTPLQQDFVYFGSASYDANAQIVERSAVTGSTLRTAVGPANSFDTTLHLTIVTENSSGVFGYGLARYTRDADTRIRVASVNSVKVADFNANQPSLLDVLVRVASGATSVSPSRVPVALLTNDIGTNVLATASQVLDMLRSYALLGSPPTVTLLPSNAGVSFAPNGSSIYTSAVFTVPAVSVSTSSSTVLQPDIAEVTVQLTLTDDVIPNNTGLMVQLAYTDSRGLTTITDTDSASCLIVYRNGTGGYEAQVRDGYGGINVTTTPLTEPSYQTTLQVVASAREQRPNTIVIGRPPRARNSETYDPTTPFTLGGGSVTITALRLQYYATVVQTDLTRSYAVTTKDYRNYNLLL